MLICHNMKGSNQILVDQIFSIAEGVFLHDTIHKMLVVYATGNYQGTKLGRRNRDCRVMIVIHIICSQSFIASFFVILLCRYNVFPQTIESELSDIWHALTNDVWKDVTFAVSEQKALMYFCSLLNFLLMLFTIKTKWHW